MRQSIAKETSYQTLKIILAKNTGNASMNLAKYSTRKSIRHILQYCYVYEWDELENQL